MPDFIYEDSRLNSTDIKVYSFINSYKGDKFYFTNDQLGEMFKVSAKSISVSVSRLIEFGYIKADYQIKADGGKIRFIVNLRHYEVVKSEITKSSSPKLRSCNDKESKVKESKVKERVHSRFSSIKNIGDKEFQELASYYNIPVSFVKNCYENLVDYCEASGRRYKNYLAALRKFIKGDAEKKGMKLHSMPVVINNPKPEKFIPVDNKRLEKIRKEVYTKIGKF